jgi:hypothetical protein
MYSPGNFPAQLPLGPQTSFVQTITPWTFPVTGSTTAQPPTPVNASAGGSYAGVVSTGVGALVSVGVSGATSSAKEGDETKKVKIKVIKIVDNLDNFIILLCIYTVKQKYDN